MATLTVATAGDSAQGGGWYSDKGRTNFGFTINRVPNSVPFEYKGQFLLIYKNSWRLKGTLSNYVVNTTTKCGSVEGVGKLSEWVLVDAGDPATTADDVYGWVVRAEGVPFAVGFCDLNNGGSQKGGKNIVRDTFGIEISYADPGSPSDRQPAGRLTGGNIAFHTSNTVAKPSRGTGDSLLPPQHPPERGSSQLPLSSPTTCL